MEEKQTPDENPFPKMDILPGIGWVKRFGELICCIYFFKDKEEKNGGAATLLDKELYE